MNEMNYLFGPVPSRRLGISLGISPIPKKTCNYSCIYCQLGRTKPLTNSRKMFFKVAAIIAELEAALAKNIAYDVITIVGEGEPTLYAGLGELIAAIHQRSDKPVAVITNGALLYDAQVRAELAQAEIVLPTLDAYNEELFKRINRPHGSLKFETVLQGLEEFSHHYQGQLWLEMMLMKDINDGNLEAFRQLLQRFRYDKLYLNTPVRPPAEPEARMIDPQTMAAAVAVLGGISIDLLESQGFHSEITDHHKAIMSIIRRHPMNQYEIEGFLKSRGCSDPEAIFRQLSVSDQVERIEYKGYCIYRLR